MKPIVIFLFSKTFTIARPWAEAGFECHLFDAAHGSDNGAVAVNSNGRIITYGGDIREQRKTLGALCRHNDVRLIGSFSPCDDLALCGTKHFEKKSLNDAMFWAKAMELFHHGVFLADYFNIPYFSENPKSMITTFHRKPDFKFHPCNYGGYLPAEHKHLYYPEIYPGRDAYKKETWIWCGNGFVIPEKKHVIPISNDYPGWKLLGGKNDRVKNIRSVTPEGFSRAVFEANYKQQSNTFFK